MTPSPSRRTLLHSTAALAGATLLPEAIAAVPRARPAGSAELTVALIGCGGRGRGAAVQALTTMENEGGGPVKLIAVADAFSDQLEQALGDIRGQRPDQVDVPEDRRFVGFDAYKKAIDLGPDVVILATPPGFRPIHFAYAVAQGRHVFMEKPVAVDAAGVRTVLRAAEEAKRRDLKVGVGLQRHHQNRYVETIRRIHDGALGKLVLLRSYWNSAGVWVRPRQEGQTEMEYQMRNWYYFNWLCGDHINEQHIHNLDVANWVMNGYPVEAQGQGGRQVRTGIDHGEIYDHHMVEFTYADGTKLLSQCRHIPNTWSQVNEFAHGSLGHANIGGGRIEGYDGSGWRYSEEDADPYQVEHDVLFRAIREGRPHNEAENGAKSTMTAILGRMATYSGKVVRWDEALASEIALVPEAYDWHADPPTLPDAEGRYPIPTPGETRVL